MRVTLTREFFFDSAQSLGSFPEGHKCRALHGHTFRLQISVSGEVDEKTGLFYDHAVIKDAAKPLVDRLDHAYLNEVEGLECPTIENICRWFWVRLQDKLPGLAEIKLYETQGAWCSYRGD